jgi:transcriptional regulator of acetoin/glycerol metabolism
VHQRVELERARRMFLATGDRGTAEQILRREVVASWERTPRHGVDLNHVAATFSRRAGESAAEAACPDEVFDEFFAANGPAAFSLVLFDRSGVVRVRRDGDSSMADLLDDVLLLPGYEYGERVVARRRGRSRWPNGPIRHSSDPSTSTTC